MPFPNVTRVVYGKSQLDRVICQLRYPPILRIDSELPSQFQDAIRTDYPLYSQRVDFQPEIAPSVNPQFPQQVVAQLTAPAPVKNHEFSAANSSWKINLTRTFLSLSTTDYIRWDQFISRFGSSYNKLMEIYTPPFFNRIGLRYIDVFRRSKLGLGDANWTDLIQPYILGILSSSVANAVTSCQSISELSLSDGESTVRIVTSLVIDINTNEQCYMIDSDFYTPKRTDPQKAFEKLEFLHDRATRLIQWIVTPTLHAAMEPQEI